MELFDAITQRRTHRGEFRADTISQEHLDRLIEAAQWAPSPFNTQPWEFLIIREAAGKNALAELTARCVVDQFKDSTFLDDNSRWMRLTEAEWEERGDGVLLTDHVDLPPVFRKDPTKLKPLLKHAKHLSILGHLGAGKLPAKEISELVRTSPLLNPHPDGQHQTTARRRWRAVDVAGHGRCRPKSTPDRNGTGHRYTVCQCTTGKSGRPRENPRNLQHPRFPRDYHAIAARLP